MAMPLRAVGWNGTWGFGYRMEARFFLQARGMTRIAGAEIEPIGYADLGSFVA